MKASKLQAGYQPNAKKDLCKDCLNFLPLNGSCTKVQGAIAPDASCTDYFDPIKRATKTPSRGR